MGITPVFAVNRDAEIGPVWPAAAGLFGRVFRVDEAESSAFYTEGRRLDTGEPLPATPMVVVERLSAAKVCRLTAARRDGFHDSS